MKIINFEIGIYNCGGNKEIYISSLKKYYQRYSQKINLLDISFQEKKDFLHKMKGVSSILALEEITDVLKSFFLKNLELSPSDYEKFNRVLEQTLKEINHL